MTVYREATATANTKKTRPARVKLALAVLWVAWATSLAALFVNQFVFKGTEIGPGWGLGILSLVVQGVLFIFVARGNPMARAVTVGFLVLAALPLPILGRLMAERAVWSAIYLIAGFVLKAIAVFFLFSAKSKEWFAFT